MKKIKSALAIISLGIIVIAFSACSDLYKSSTLENESVLLEQKCCQEIADFEKPIIKDKACFNEELKKAKADDRQFIAVDYLIDKCGENRKNIDFLGK